MVIEGVLHVKRHIYTGGRPFCELDKGTINFGPVSGVEIVGIVFVEFRIVISDGDIAKFWTNNRAQDVQFESVWPSQVFGKLIRTKSEFLKFG